MLVYNIQIWHRKQYSLLRTKIYCYEEKPVFLYKNLIAQHPRDFTMKYEVMINVKNSDLVKIVESFGNEDSLLPMGEHLSALRFNSRKLFVRSCCCQSRHISFTARHSLIICQRQNEKREEEDRSMWENWLSARFEKKKKNPPTNSPSGELLHCCVSLSRMGRRGRHIPGAEAGRRDPWKLDKLTTYASHSRTPPFRCSTFVSEGFLPSLFLVHLW